MKLGLVTYNIAADWSLDKIIKKCEELGYEGVELRTTHAHEVENKLTEHERSAVKKHFENSSVTLVGLGSVYEYHSADPDELKNNIEGTRNNILLAADLGTDSVKVRPNTFPEDIEKEQTIEQIGKAIDEVGSFGKEHGVKIRLEIHGNGTSHPPYCRKMLDIADNDNVYACWNCNETDKDENGSINKYFNMLKDKIDLVHMHEFFDDYPYKNLFKLLKKKEYDGWCLAEIQASEDPDRVLKYYKKTFDLYTG